MATTITPATLTATISETISLNGQPVNSTQTLTIPSITQIDKRIVTIPTSEVAVIGFGSAVSTGQFIAANVKYIRISNLDDTNFVRIRVKKSGADTFDIKLQAGKTFMLGNVSESVSATGASFSAFQTADTIDAQADTAAVQIEYFVATT